MSKLFNLELEAKTINNILLNIDKNLNEKNKDKIFCVKETGDISNPYIMSTKDPDVLVSTIEYDGYTFRPDICKYNAGFQIGYYENINDKIEYIETNNTLCCNKFPVHVPAGYLVKIDTKNHYVLTQYSGGGVILKPAQVLIDNLPAAGYLKSNEMIFPKHDYDIDLYFRIGNEEDHNTEINLEEVDIDITIYKIKSKLIIQGNIFIYIANSQINVECSSTARAIVDGKFVDIQSTKTQLEKPESGTHFICLGQNGFYLRNATYLTANDFAVAYYYNGRFTSLSKNDSIFCNTIPLTDWYQREDIPIYINNRKLNFTLDNRINKPYVDDFGYFYRLNNGFNYNGNPFYFSNNAGVKLTTDSIVKKNTTSIANKKILTVGDSVTRRGWYQQQIKTHESTVEFVGTQTSYYNNIQCEGYSGLRSEDVLNSSVLNLTNGTAIPNPFYNPASENIDFEYYCESNNIHPDYVIIEFGLNETSSKNYNTYMRNFISSVKAYDSSIIVYVVQPFGESDTGAPNKKTANHRRAMKECVLESYKFEDCVKIPCYFIMVDECDYDYTNVDYGYGDTTVHIASDGVHPKEQTGFAKLGDMIYNWLGMVE